MIEIKHVVLSKLQALGKSKHLTKPACLRHNNHNNGALHRHLAFFDQLIESSIKYSLIDALDI